MSDYPTKDGNGNVIIAKSNASGYSPKSLGLNFGRVPKFRIAGDSICSQNGSFTQLAPGGTQFQLSIYPYWWTQVMMKTGWQMTFEMESSVIEAQRMGQNSGNGGDDFATFLQPHRIDYILDLMDLYGEDILVLVLGTNDNNAGVKWDTMLANAAAVVTKVRERGKDIILTTVLSRNAVDGSSDWGTSGGTTTAQKRSNFMQYNRALERYAEENNVRFVDWTTNFSDKNGNAKTGYTTDSVHPGAIGADSMSNDFIYACNDILPQGRFAHAIYDSYDATWCPEGNLLNGDFSGTGGNVSAGSGTGTITAVGGGAAVVPDNFQIAKSTSTSTNLTVAVVADEDGIDVLELEWTANGTGNASEDWRLNYYNAGSTSFVGALMDELYRVGCEAKIVSNAAGVLKNIQPRLSHSATSSKVGTTISFDAATREIRDSSNGLGIFRAAGDRWVIVNNAANAANNGAWKYEYADAGKIRLTEKAKRFNGSTFTVTDTPQVLVDEAAGNNITLQNPFNTVAWGASATLTPTFNNRYLGYVCPLFHVPFTANLTPRIGFYIDGTKTGTAKVRIRSPFLTKVLNKPAVLAAIATDD